MPNVITHVKSVLAHLRHALVVTRERLEHCPMEHVPATVGTLMTLEMSCALFV